MPPQASCRVAATPATGFGREPSRSGWAGQDRAPPRAVNRAPRAISVETLHYVEIPHAQERFYFHRMQSFRLARSFRVNCRYAKRAADIPCHGAPRSTAVLASPCPDKGDGNREPVAAARPEAP